jgi:hypothetical protein
MARRNLNVIVAIHGLLVGITATMSNPQSTAGPHHGIQGACHPASRLNAFNLAPRAAVLKGLTIGDDDQAIAVKLCANDFIENVTRPDLQY